MGYFHKEAQINIFLNQDLEQKKIKKLMRMIKEPGLKKSMRLINLKLLTKFQKLRACVELS